MVAATLRRMQLLGFRSISAQGVDFDNPTFFVGRNGSGKSNFADAFAFLSEAMVSPLQGVIEQRGGFAAVAHRSSARGRPTNLTLAVRLSNPDGDTTDAHYYIDLRSRKDYDFEIARERCDVIRADGSRRAFDRRTVRGTTVWDSKIDSLAPAIEPNALALPLVGGFRPFRAVFGFLSRMRTYRIEPAGVRAMQGPDGGAELRSDGRNAASVLRQIQRRSPAHGDRIRQLLESVVPGTVDVRPKRHGNKLTLEFTQDRAGAEPVKFEAFSMSDGTLRVLGLIKLLGRDVGVAERLQHLNRGVLRKMQLVPAGRLGGHVSVGQGPASGIGTSKPSRGETPRSSRRRVRRHLIMDRSLRHACATLAGPA